MRQRLDYIDRAKGILIILMVIGHIWQSGYVFEFIYAFHMPGFFVISGMLMHHTRSYQKNYLDFMKSRLFAYGIPFLFIEFLGCMTDIVRNAGPTLNWKGYIFNTIIFDFNDSNLWFLVNLCLIELMIALLLKWIRDPRVLLGICAVLFIVRYFMPVDVLYVSTVSSVFKYSLFFTSGFLFRELLVKKNKALCVACTAFVAVYAVFATGLTGDKGVVKDICYIITGIAGSYAVLQFAQIGIPRFVDRILSLAGQNTLIIYGTHHFYYACIGVLLGITDYTLMPVGVGIVMLIAVVILEIPTIYIINRWLPFLAGKRYRKVKQLQTE